MTTSYPKGGSAKRFNSGTMGRHQQEWTSGNPYFYRPLIGKSSEERLKQRMSNVYGKESPEKNRDGIYDSPLRTIRSPV